MGRSLFKKTIKGDIAVIDSLFPQKEPFGFRNTEINEYFKRINNVDAYAMHPTKPWGDAWFPWSYGSDREVYEKNRQGYLEHYPENKSRLHYLNEHGKYRFKLAYSYFLAETYVLLPFYEKNKIPFIFVLYPGGAFGIDNEQSDKMLERICRSKYCKGVIVTQRITKDYLIAKSFCPEEKITYIYGYFSQFEKKDVKQKKFYQKDKQTFDVCFVAAKYTEKGVDKGYDLFIETAREICKITDDIMFHVVGGFDESEVDITDIKSRIKFYGYKRPDFLSEFYSEMDIFLSPNRPYKIFPGNFDGFPLGVDASYCGVALFASDELDMNDHYIDNENIIIVPVNANKIADKIIKAYSNLEDLYELSAKGQTNTQALFDTSYQIDQRIKLFEKYVKVEFNQ